MAECRFEDDEPGEREVVLPPEAKGARLDAALAERLSGLSRSHIAKLLKEGAIRVDGQPAKPNRKVRGGERVSVNVPEPEIIEAKPERIALDVLYEDADLIAVHKPAGMVTHPSAGHGQGTLVNALLAHCADLSGINGRLRPGIVHRLDGGTSGVIVAAKNDRAHQALQAQFMARRVEKQYLALCHGDPSEEAFACTGRIGRHPKRRTEMTVLRRPGEGRPSETGIEVLQRFRELDPALLDGRSGPLCLLLAKPKTGRTHQIRVHLAQAGFPVLADGRYGKEDALAALGLARQALHAWKLALEHPRTGEKMRFEAPLAGDMREALRRLGGRWPP